MRMKYDAHIFMPVKALKTPQPPVSNAEPLITFVMSPKTV